jgi:hypothetical protein
MFIEGKEKSIKEDLGNCPIFRIQIGNKIGSFAVLSAYTAQTGVYAVDPKLV